MTVRETVPAVLARIALLVVTAATLVGCGAGPTQAGSAVIVGQSTVPLAEIQRRMDIALAKPGLAEQLRAQGNTTAELARELASRQAQHLLLEQAARRAGVRVDEAAVSAELARRGGVDMLLETSIFDEAGLRQAVRDELIAIEIARRHLDRLAVTLDLVDAGTRAAAVDMAQRMAAGPAQADAVLAEAGAAAQRDLRLVAAVDPSAAVTFPFGTPAGTVVAFQNSQDPNSWVVARITERTAPVYPPGDPRIQVANRLDEATLDAIGRRLTQPLAIELGVRVNPRYGVWDPLSMAVAPDSGSVGMLLPATLG